MVRSSGHGCILCCVSSHAYPDHGVIDPNERFCRVSVLLDRLKEISNLALSHRCHLVGVQRAIKEGLLAEAIYSTRDTMSNSFHFTHTQNRKLYEPVRSQLTAYPSCLGALF